MSPGKYVVRSIDPPEHEHTYPTTIGGTLWPSGISNPAIGNVTPLSITQSLAQGQSHRQNVSITLPLSGALTNLVDVFLLFDDTGSFVSNSPIVRAAFPTIMTQLQASLVGIDLGFGVGRFEEYANFGSEYSTGRPFVLNQPIVAASTSGYQTSIQAALDRTTPGYGGDQPETDIEALFQVVTGRGFDGNNNGSVLDSGAAGLASTQVAPGNSGDVPSFASFTADPANSVFPAAGNVGGAGFRAGALPIILLATDTGFAYQPKGESVIVGVDATTLPVSALTQTSRATTPFSSGAGIQETITGLNALGALVIGLGTNGGATLDPRQQLESISKLTGATNRTLSTIANGTTDPIAPGDPLYFQIASGFASSVANGVVSAIQNAVTNVAVDIDVVASDPRVHLVNHTGIVRSIGSGMTANFDIEFIGDGAPRRFDLQFVRAGTNVVLGSIPIVLGTPIPGDGYDFEDLDEGEIEIDDDFGSRSRSSANQAPTALGLSSSSVNENLPIGSMVGSLSTVDPDIGDSFTYSLVAETGSTDNARFTLSGSTLVTNAVFDYESTPSVSIRLRTTDQGGLFFEREVTIGVGNINTNVSDRRLFYNRSTSPVFGDGTGNPINAVDETKSPLLPGETATFANYTGVVKGINGLIVDIPTVVNPTLSDFQFATWNGIDAAGFVPVENPPVLTVIPSGGVSGATRVKLEFADGTIRNTWLRIVVFANGNTDLTADDTFYFGSAVADLGVGNIGSPVQVRINASDTGTVRQNQSAALNSVGIANVFDVNKDGRVNATDTGLIRQNQNPANIVLITAPPAFSATSVDFGSMLAGASIDVASSESTVESDEVSAIKRVGLYNSASEPSMIAPSGSPIKNVRSVLQAEAVDRVFSQRRSHDSKTFLRSSVSRLGLQNPSGEWSEESF